jgi:hypothetical protein
MILEDKIESVFGSCFSTHGLGGVLTCGVIGIKAGLSHSPVQGVSVPVHAMPCHAMLSERAPLMQPVPSMLPWAQPPLIPPTHLAPLLQGKERYVFFSFPHIAIDSEGNVGGISRPNRPGTSSACGALIACTGHLKAEGLDANLKVPGVHDPLEPE